MEYIVIDVFWIATEDIPSQQLTALACLLDQSECDRAGRFRKESDYSSFIAAHALTRVCLSQRIGGRPPALRFRRGIYGKPALVLPAQAAHISFSLSHTEGLAVVAIGGDAQVGIDAERLVRRGSTLFLTQSYFSTSEQTLLKGLVNSQEHVAFYQLWTLKEACLKALGLGLSQGMNRLSFSLDPPALQGRTPEFAAGTWQFYQKMIGNDHLMSVAVQHDSKGSVIFRLHPVTAIDLVRADPASRHSYASG